MRVDWAIPCRYCEVNDNRATIVGGGIDFLFLPVFPAPVQCILAVRLVAQAEEVGQFDKTVTVAAIDPGGARVGEASGQLAGEAAARNPEWLVGFHLPVAVVFPAEEPGTYRIEVSVDNHTLPVPLHIRPIEEAAEG